MDKYPWFRVYNEILVDRKIECAAKKTKLPRVTIRGVWVTLMAMANDSPIRGYLMWTEDMPVSEEDIAVDLEMEIGVFKNLLETFISLKMVGRENDGRLSCTNFDKRQFQSDTSTPRVRQHREKQKKECNVSETGKKRYRNGPDTDTDTDTDTEQKQIAPQKKRRTKSPAPAAVNIFRENAHRYPAKSYYDDLAQTIGEEQANLDFWGQIVKTWVGLGWNPTNVVGMLDFFKRHELPPGNHRGRDSPGQKRVDGITDEEFLRACREEAKRDGF